MNQTTSRIPQKFIHNWVLSVYKELHRKKILKTNRDLTIVFVSAAKIKKLNSQYRGKNKPTDILSFDSIEPSSLGELVLCLPILKKQALEHKLTVQREIGYMVLHGILHLLGYDHEKSQKEARQMFSLQDQIFEKLS